VSSLLPDPVDRAPSYKRYVQMYQRRAPLFSDRVGKGSAVTQAGLVSSPLVREDWCLRGRVREGRACLSNSRSAVKPVRQLAGMTWGSSRADGTVREEKTSRHQAKLGMIVRCERGPEASEGGRLRADASVLFQAALLEAVEDGKYRLLLLCSLAPEA
jgi:hypothetical protein